MKYFTILLLPFFFACNGNSEKTTAPVENKDTAIVRESAGPAAAATFSVLEFDKNNNPVRDSVKGPVTDGVHWSDAGGEGIVMLVQTENKMTNDRQSQSISAYCYRRASDTWALQWSVRDGIMDCEVDATCQFYPGSLSVTDVDNNNTAEICFLYHLSCKGDVSPDDKKLILYEGRSKYAIRGSAILEMNGQQEGGQKNADLSFQKAPKALLDLANTRWDKFGLTRY